MSTRSAGVAIAVLVLSHSLTIATQTPLVAGLNNFIVAWNMPLFFFVAGWAMALQPLHTPLESAKRRALTLLIPYLAWIGVLWVVGFPWSDGGPGVGTWFQILLAPTEMWFLYCLFLATVLFTIVRTVGRRPVPVMAGVVVIALAATATSQWLPAGMLTLANLGWLLPFLAAGFYGCQLSRRSPRMSTLAKAALAVPALVLVWLAVGADVAHAMFALWPLSLVPGGGAAASLANHAVRYALAAAGIATVWYAVRLAPARAQKALSSLGIATLGIYALNSPMLTGMRLAFPAWSVVAGPEFTVPVALVAASIVLLAEWLITAALGMNALTRIALLGRRAKPAASSGT